jgi:hypothetical protein
MSAIPDAEARAVGYRIVLSPGWAQIPLRSGTEEAIDAILDVVSGGRDLDAKLEAEREAVAAQLRKSAKSARDNCGVHLFLPMAPIHGLVMPASFVTADIKFGSVDPLDPAAFVARMVAGPNAKRMRIGGADASRTETTHLADPRRDIPWPSRRVDYILPHPEDSDRWLVVTFSVLQPAGQEDLSSTWVELFDAMMTTFRWTHAAA